IDKGFPPEWEDHPPPSKGKHGGSYITREDTDMLRAFEESPRIFAERFMKGGDWNILFLDEARYCVKAGRALRLLLDLFSERLKIIAYKPGGHHIQRRRIRAGKY
ncbi:MAG: hypothetical protein ACP5QI_05880, partial [Candidatus Bathyarchaeia archaeon]